MKPRTSPSSTADRGSYTYMTKAEKRWRWAQPLLQRANRHTRCTTVLMLGFEANSFVAFRDPPCECGNYGDAAKQQRWRWRRRCQASERGRGGGRGGLVVEEVWRRMGPPGAGVLVRAPPDLRWVIEWRGRSGVGRRRRIHGTRDGDTALPSSSSRSSMEKVPEQLLPQRRDS
jgi:hypothetical protein